MLKKLASSLTNGAGQTKLRIALWIILLAELNLLAGWWLAGVWALGTWAALMGSVLGMYGAANIGATWVHSRNGGNEENADA